MGNNRIIWDFMFHNERKNKENADSGEISMAIA